MGNIIVIETGDGLVIVDTSDSLRSATAAKNDLGTLMDQPVKKIIFTHHHGDHVGGAAAFIGPNTEIIATKELINIVDNYNQRLLPKIYHEVVVQYNLDLEPDQRSVVVNLDDNFEEGTNIVYPTVVFDDCYKFDQGDLSFELYAAPGETPDHLFVWIPQMETLCCGDMYYPSFPNISSPMKQNRCAFNWYKSIEKSMSFEPSCLVPSHTIPITGKETLKEILGNYHDAIKFVDDKVIEALNTGVPLERLKEEVKELPPRLRDLKYLQERYGKLSWALEGNYRYYTGWFDGNAAWLESLPAVQRYTELMQLAGGPHRIVERAISLQKDGDDQLALELLEMVLTIQPNHRVAIAVKANSLERLASNSYNTNSRGFYKSDASRTAKKLESL
jgi:alkyl sulfatase BDS1-like metallo-beta-lactamase superfamily hydrolase